MDKELLLAKNDLTSISRRNKIETVRYKLLSISTVVFLSKDLFKHNIDIETILLKADIHFRPYVFKSRTLIVAKIVRIIEEASGDQLFLLLDTLKEFLFENKNISSPPKKRTGENDIDDLLDQFGRV